MKNKSELHPLLQEKIKMLINLCALSGYSIAISECVRTVEEQNALYAKGRTVAGQVVTNAKGSNFSSMHQWGVAFDFYRNDGKGAYNNTDGFFDKVGKIGQSIGLEWGGAWKSIKDRPHFQLPNWGSTATKLRTLYGQPYKFFETWQKEAVTPEVKEVVSMDVHKSNIKVVQEWLDSFVGAVVSIDGVFDAQDKKEMIKALQHGLLIDATGIEDEMLYKAFNAVGEAPKYVVQGTVVKCICGLLFVYGYNPQYFGTQYTKTVADAVEQYQKDHNLTSDRIVGDKTLQSLLKL